MHRRSSVDNIFLNKPNNPRYKVNLLSLVTFWFTLKIFKRGYKHDLNENDLTLPLPEHKSLHLGDKITRYWTKEVMKAKRKGKKPKLGNVLFKQFGRELFLRSIWVVIMELCIRIFQPFFLGLLVRYFQAKNLATINVGGVDVTYLGRIYYYWTPQRTEVQKDEAIFFACGVFLCSLFVMIILHPYQLSVNHIGMKMRIACCSLMYRKALQLDICSTGNITTGKVINLMSNDVNRYEMLPVHMHYLWVAPIQYFIVLYLISKELGFASYYGAISIFIMLPIVFFLGIRLRTLRTRVAEKTDQRVREMNEIITGVQVIKMYAWEPVFTKKIMKSRRIEIKNLTQTVFIKGCTMSFIMFTTRLAIFLTVLAYVLDGKTITAESVFFITAYYQIVRQTISVYLPQGVAHLAEVSIATARIQKFLLYEETTISNPSPFNKSVVEPSESNEDINNNISVSLINTTAMYGTVICLNKINLELVSGKLTVLVGPIGAGKTCLLNLILGEMVPVSGTIKNPGIKSFASQEPWLFQGSVRQNILFGHKYNKDRYKNVIKCCSLIRDFTLLPYGDKTIVGERGISLSGGQRARINLARAIYKCADIYLLDDPLSAVDTHVGKALFDECIVGFLKKKLVVLATHQLQYLHQADQIVVLYEGVIQAKGTYQSLQKSGIDFAKLLVSEPLINKIEEEEVKNAAKAKTAERSRLSIDSNLFGGPTAPKTVAEIRSEGAVSWNVYKGYLKAGGNWCCVFFVFFLFIFTQIVASGSDYFISEWVIMEEKKKHHKSQFSFYYLLNRKLAITVYSTLIAVVIVFSLARSFIFFLFCMRASIRLHDNMYKSVSNAKMSFFNANSSGRILNRFSKDLGAVDEILPSCMIDSYQVLLNLMGVVLILFIVNYLFLAPIAVICVIFAFLRNFYLHSSRSIKRLEGITKSPVFTHVSATLNGLPTVRSHVKENLLSDEFDKLQDIHSSAFYFFLCTSRAFGFWLDCLCAVFIGLVTFSFFLRQRDKVEPSEVGLCITQCISLTGLFQWGMKQSAELENQMTSVERILEFSTIEHEPALFSEPPNSPPPPDWPQKGHIEFKNASLRYNATAAPVIKNLNIIIYPKEKVGIVGRTGAGKSSLLSCIFRLAYLEGEILIDGVNISNIGLHELRKKISIIPQEPLIFSGTMRENLDPYGEYTDSKIMTSLISVEMRSAQLYGTECLDIMMYDGGANLSVGQRQLVCLARAILRDNKILVLDEATANMDPQTDKFIQATIRLRFKDCTVLTIAHRLNTVMDSDRVLVMDAGKAVEFDHPHLLLKQKNGIFTGMVETTGAGTASVLKSIAKENYEKKYAGKTSQ